MPSRSGSPRSRTNEIRSIERRLAHAFLAGGRLPDLVAVARKGRGQDTSNLLFIVNDQYTGTVNGHTFSLFSVLPLASARGSEKINLLPCFRGGIEPYRAAMGLDDPLQMDRPSPVPSMLFEYCSL